LACGLIATKALIFNGKIVIFKDFLAASIVFIDIEAAIPILCLN
jgi:hypothetical protein